jgi:hypothetical protein
MNVVAGIAAVSPMYLVTNYFFTADLLMAIIAGTITGFPKSSIDLIFTTTLIHHQENRNDYTRPNQFYYVRGLHSTAADYGCNRVYHK